MQEIIEQYKIWLLANSRAKNTIDVYIANIKIFIQQTAISSPQSINSEMVNNYIALLKTKYSQATCNQHLSAIKSFLDFNNVLIRVPKTKLPQKKEVKITTQDEFDNIVIPMVEREFTNAIKIKAFLAFLYYTGLRVEDASRVTRSQFDLESNMLLANISKQNMEKKILIPSELKDILIRYFASEAEEINAFNMTLFMMENLFTKLRWMLPELKLHPHKFRKSCATNAYRLGMKLEQIQQMLGHKSIETTQIYVQPQEFDEIKDQYLKLEKEKLTKQRRIK